MGSFGPDDIPLVEAPGPVIPQELEEEVEKEPSLAEFLIAVMDADGSDLHLTAGLPPMIRVNGELRPLKGYRKLLPKDLQELIYSMLTQKQREVFEENLELDVSYALPGKARFRVNVFQQRDSVGAVMRLIPFGIKSLEELGLPQVVSEFAGLRRGLVLVTGITGSGKSTTLAALLDIINRERSEHIMTVEDPIEFLHRHKKAVVNQREVGTDTHGFGAALKHVLRQDPDVILVGEMRDLETISTALTAAETGHLVFATLHTQDAPSRSTESSTSSHRTSSSRSESSWRERWRESFPSSFCRLAMQRVVRRRWKFSWQRRPSETSSGRARRTRSIRPSR